MKWRAVVPDGSGTGDVLEIRGIRNASDTCPRLKRFDSVPLDSYEERT